VAVYKSGINGFFGSFVDANAKSAREQCHAHNTEDEPEHEADH